MNPYSPTATKSIFRKYGIKPKKYLGQNFVVNKSVINNIIKAANLNPDDTVIEIGSGLGALTIELAKKVKQVIAVEKDGAMCKILQETLQKENIKNVTIINADILDSKNWKLPAKGWSASGGKIKNWKLVANIPYYITQPIIRLFLESEMPPQSITLLIQKEVAQRICAAAPKMNLLAISVQFYAQPEIISYISKNNFWPRPKVDSAILKITHIDKNRKKIDANIFFKTTRAGFSSPRKMLIGNLHKKLGIHREIILNIYLNLGINPEARAENLTIENWVELSTALFSHSTENVL
ncbi:MAG: ribosomal RNA small subunit methyltransferase A [Parcubacteria group bacterium GW2011_GWA2_38_13b]|nr:MAG: ribosomal RNA small subunit methyltransferase A [Parcubacteria group bacterium GW2011_GWA2_38_13b]